jgi:hypothetical protein
MSFCCCHESPQITFDLQNIETQRFLAVKLLESESEGKEFQGGNLSTKPLIQYTRILHIMWCFAKTCRNPGILVVVAAMLLLGTLTNFFWCT